MTRTRTTSDDIDLKAIGAATLKSLPRLCVLAVLVAAATYFTLGSLAKRYQSEATLAIISKGDVNPYNDPTRANAIDSLTTAWTKRRSTLTSALCKARIWPRRSFAS